MENYLWIIKMGSTTIFNIALIVVFIAIYRNKRHIGWLLILIASIIEIIVYVLFNIIFNAFIFITPGYHYLVYLNIIFFFIDIALFIIMIIGYLIIYKKEYKEGKLGDFKRVRVIE